MAWDLAGHWHYSGDPSTSNRDNVRFRVGDTDITDGLVSDEEIDFALTESSSVYAAAAFVCDHIAARFSREADKSVSASVGQSVTHHLSQRAAAFRALAKALRQEGSAATVGAPYCGGISIADKADNEEDSDIVQPFFKRGQYEYN